MFTLYPTVYVTGQFYVCSNLHMRELGPSSRSPHKCLIKITRYLEKRLCVYPRKYLLKLDNRQNELTVKLHIIGKYFIFLWFEYWTPLVVSHHNSDGKIQIRLNFTNTQGIREALAPLFIQKFNQFLHVVLEIWPFRSNDDII